MLVPAAPDLGALVRGFRVRVTRRLTPFAIRHRFTALVRVSSGPG